jgi:signal recognition particle subunit SRP54
MFEVLIQKLNGALKNLTNKGKLSEKDIDEGLRQIRLALLEADVNYKVVKGFLDKVRARAIEAPVLQSLTPGQQIIKIVHEELINVFGKAEKLMVTGHMPFVIMLVGLQGSGKTTTAAKLGALLKKEGQFPLLVAADTRRPAAIDQLAVLGKQVDVPVYTEYGVDSPIKICENSLKKAKESASSVVILDTQGRLHVDESLMQELTELKKKLQPAEVLLVVDAMTGQESVRIAEEFNKNVGLTGLIFTKMDGDARGGAALSIRSITGVPIKYMGTGEKMNSLETFYPDRMVSRIMGMGDVMTLIERAEKDFDQEQAKKFEKKVRANSFDLEDFLQQLKEVRKMGPIGQIIQMIPGASKLPADMFDGREEGQLKKIEAIILSMTPLERSNPEIIDGSRKKRIARGSGTATRDVNQLINQFAQIRKLMKAASRGKLPNNLKMFGM